MANEFRVIPDDPNEFRVVPDDPAERLSRVLPDTSGDAIEVQLTNLATEIKRDLQKLLRLHRDIHDGIQLAAEQIQDKRIEWLEAGPEVTMQDIFIEAALTFFLESPLVGKAFKLLFKGAQKGAVKSTKELKEVLDALATRIASRRTKIEQELNAAIAKVKDLTEVKMTPAVQTQLDRAQADMAALQLKLRRSQSISAPIESASQKATKLAEITEKELNEFFTKEKQDMLAGLGSAAIKTYKVVKDKPLNEHVSPSQEPNSIGVQIRDLAQTSLRNTEYRFAGIEINVDAVMSYAYMNHALSLACHLELENISSVVHFELEKSQDDAVSVTEQIMYLKQLTTLEFEKLIWALIVSDAYFYPTPDLEKRLSLEKLYSETGEPGNFLSGTDKFYLLETKPMPKHMSDYFYTRFFSQKKDLKKGDDKSIWKELLDVKEKFTASPYGQDTFKLLRGLAEKKELEK